MLWHRAGGKQKTGTETFTLNGSAGYFVSRIEIQARREGKNRNHCGQPARDGDCEKFGQEFLPPGARAPG